jgi:autotransporter translocation and assembly factor TamB
VAYDPLILNPELDLAAACSVVDPDDGTEYEVTLSVQGTALNPAPEFTSTPALDFNGIFRLLAFGTISSQIEYGAALGTAAGQLLSKKVEKVGLDEFTVLPSGTVIGTVGQASLRMGKYFDHIPFPLWVRYEAPLLDMSSGEVRVEHKFKSYLTLSGTAQSKYDRYGLGVGLKKDF